MKAEKKDKKAAMMAEQKVDRLVAQTVNLLVDNLAKKRAASTVVMLDMMVVRLADKKDWKLADY